jgi:hypothetical protein
MYLTITPGYDNSGRQGRQSQLTWTLDCHELWKPGSPEMVTPAWTGSLGFHRNRYKPEAGPLITLAGPAGADERTSIQSCPLAERIKGTVEVRCYHPAEIEDQAAVGHALSLRNRLGLSGRRLPSSRTAGTPLVHTLS